MEVNINPGVKELPEVTILEQRSDYFFDIFPCFKNSTSTLSTAVVNSIAVAFSSMHKSKIFSASLLTLLFSIVSPPFLNKSHSCPINLRYCTSVL